MIKVIIVDDENLIRKMITGILNSECPDVSVLAQSGNVESAYSEIKRHNPDLVLLDIKLSDGTGFDLLERFDTINFKVIFVTAYEEYAIKAFEFSAIDYVVKPINPENLVLAIKKAEHSIQAELSLKLNTLLSNLSTPSEDNKKIVLKTSDNIHIININNILRLESDQNYSVFHLLDGRNIMVSKTLGEYEELLSQNDFFRVHKSHLINLKQIKRYEKSNGGSLVMSNDSHIPVASRKKEQLLGIFEMM
jgi:two-component system LytT family response regulator